MPKLLIIIATALFVVACSDSAPKAQGEECFASSECDIGLVCDMSTCQTMLTPQPDASVTPPPDGMSDAAPGTPDAAPAVDAAPGTPDAMIATPDAMVPDAMVPDAMVTPDAAVNDAAVFDAMP